MARHAGPCCAAAVVHVDRRRDEVVVVVVDGDDVEVIGYGSGPTDIDAVVASIDTAPVWGGVDDETTAPDHRTAATTATATGGEHLSGTFDGVSVRWDVTGGAK